MPGAPENPEKTLPLGFSPMDKCLVNGTQMALHIEGRGEGGILEAGLVVL